MVRKSKKQSVSWRAMKAIARGTWSVAKFTGRQIKKGASWTAAKAQEKKKLQTLKKNPTYNKESELSELKVIKTITGDYDTFQKQLDSSSRIILLFGRRGSGKSALGFRLMENINSAANRHCYVLGVAQDVLPKWITSVEDIQEVKNGGVVLVDEGALSFSSRESMNKEHKQLGKLMAIARHKDLTLIFITQNTGMIDKNVLQLTDTLLMKEGSLLQMEMERTAVQKFYKKAEDAFKDLKDKRKYVYVIDGDFEGVIESALPSFWSDKVSKSRR
ncbi:MAG TPA: ATP-binding protein [Candidatus Nanoarchaeia archaeon]|nr:ATP-binding protein [Candidatus Nanoarchaeia archaeon]